MGRDRMTLYFDGGARPNPGQCTYGIALRDREHEHNDMTQSYSYFHDQIGYGTNNIAEWTGCLRALDVAEQNGANGDTNIRLFGDSMLVVNQAMGRWKCSASELKVFLAQFNRRRKDFANVEVIHVRREFNFAGVYLEAIAKL